MSQAEVLELRGTTPRMCEGGADPRRPRRGLAGEAPGGWQTAGPRGPRSRRRPMRRRLPRGGQVSHVEGEDPPQLHGNNCHPGVLS